MKAAAVARSSALGPTLLLLLSTLLLPAVLACEPRKHNFGKREEGSGSEISLNDQGSAAAIAAYKCDPSSCKLPSCRCVRPGFLRTCPACRLSPRALTSRPPMSLPPGRHRCSGRPQARASDGGPGAPSTPGCCALTSLLPPRAEQDETPQFIVFTAYVRSSSL